MDNGRKIIGAITLLGITTVTLYTTLEHHRVISEHYGMIATLFVPLIAVSSFILGAFISILFQWGINIIQFEQIVKLLPANEKAIIEVLFNKRSITQADLSAETGLSRLMVSRIVSNLEKKGVITKKPLENTNQIESSLYRMHPSTQLLSKMPGLSEKRLIIVISLVFIFGISLSVLNSFHIFALGHPLRPAMYLLAIEFLALGGLSSLLFRKTMIYTQFDRNLSILPTDEREILKTIYLKKSITQRGLVEKTGIHKMKVSRILAKFKQRGIIDKKPYGYTNLIISKI